MRQPAPIVGLESAFSGHLLLVKVNPLQARSFAQAHGTRTKTDAVDARMLTAMGDALDLAPDRPADENQHALKELQVAHIAMVKGRSRLKNRMKTQTLAIIKRQTGARLRQIKRQLAEIDGELKTLLRQCQVSSQPASILTCARNIRP